MLTYVVRSIFDQFNWKVLKDDEKGALNGGIAKHQSVIRVVAFFLLFQLALAAIAPSMLTLLSVCSFISLLLGGAWYAISFQNVSADQLEAGVADYITKRMFRALILSFNVLPVGLIVFIIRTVCPEIPFPELTAVPLLARVPIMLGNIVWVMIVWKDVYQASVAYDAADSLLGDGFPTLMRGARANATNLPILENLGAMRYLLEAMARQAGVPEKDLVSPKPARSDESTTS